MNVDYYIRLSTIELADLALQHEISEVDKHLANGRLEYGYTEWSAAWCDRRISLVWDWYLSTAGVIEIEVSAGLRGNLMLIDQRGLDCGVQETMSQVLSWVDTLNWQKVLMQQDFVVGKRFQ